MLALKPELDALGFWPLSRLGCSRPGDRGESYRRQSKATDRSFAAELGISRGPSSAIRHQVVCALRSRRYGDLCHCARDSCRSARYCMHCCKPWQPSDCARYFGCGTRLSVFAFPPPSSMEGPSRDDGQKLRNWVLPAAHTICSSAAHGSTSAARRHVRNDGASRDCSG